MTGGARTTWEKSHAEQMQNIGFILTVEQGNDVSRYVSTATSEILHSQCRLCTKSLLQTSLCMEHEEISSGEVEHDGKRLRTTDVKIDYPVRTTVTASVEEVQSNNGI